jgi:hypothetical protein
VKNGASPPLAGSPRAPGASVSGATNAGRPAKGCLSNRKTTPPKNRDPGLGIDRLSVAFPVRSWEREASAWQSERVGHPGTPQEAWQRNGRVRVEGAEVFVGVANIPATGEVWGKVEFNPSRVVDPEGVGLAPVIELPTVARRVWKAAQELVTPGVGIGDARVKRLDVARDFDVEQTGFFIRGLGPIPRPWARRSFVYNDPGRGLAETLFVGSGAGGVRLYDKHREAPEKAPEGRLRWEVEARDRWCSNLAGIDRLSDVSADAVAALAANRWEWSGMGVEVAAIERVVELVVVSGLSPAKQRGFLGHLMLMSMGRAPKLSNDTAALYNRLIRRLGVVMGPGLFDQGGDVIRLGARLDWDSGREVVELRAA